MHIIGCFYQHILPISSDGVRAIPETPDTKVHDSNNVYRLQRDIIDNVDPDQIRLAPDSSDEDEFVTPVSSPWPSNAMLNVGLDPDIVVYRLDKQTTLTQPETNQGPLDTEPHRRTDVSRFGRERRPPQRYGYSPERFTYHIRDHRSGWGHIAAQSYRVPSLRYARIGQIRAPP